MLENLYFVNVSKSVKVLSLLLLFVNTVGLETADWELCSAPLKPPTSKCNWLCCNLLLKEAPP